MSNREWVGAFEPFAQRLIDLYECPGLVLGVAKDGETVYHKGFGFRDREKRLPVGIDTVAGIASCTKSFTCVAIMQLQEAGKLSVHDPVVKYLPDFRTPDPDRTARITLHHLMSNSAGLPPLKTLTHVMAPGMKGDNSVADPSALEKLAPVTTAAEMLDFIANADVQLLGEPGEHFSYSNDGFALLGAVIEAVSGQPYEAYMAKHIFQPAGMTRTTFAPVHELDDVMTLYAAKRREGGAQEDQEIYASPQWQEIGPFKPAGGLRSTVHDMLRYCEIYRTGGLVGDVRILSAESVKAMTTPYIRMNENTWYSYGLMVIPDYHGVTVIEHGGALKGVASWFTILPEAGLTGAILNNLGGVPSAQILLSAMNGVAGLPIETKRIAYTETALPENLGRYEGRYVSGEGAELIVTAADGGLQVVIGTGAQKQEYLYKPVGEHLFRGTFKETELVARFMLDEQGNVWAMSQGLRIIRKAT